MAIDLNTFEAKAKVEEILRDFQEGCITLVYSRDDKNFRTLIYCSIEMLADWVERPTELDTHEKFRTASKKIEFNVRRSVLSTAECLKWIEDCSKGQVNLFLTSKERQADSPPGERIVHALNLTAPFEFPQFLYPYNTFWGEMPIYGHRPCGARWFQLRTDIEVLPNIFGNDEYAKPINEWIDKTLQMKFSERRYLLGSCHLFLTNPVLKEISYGPTDDWKSLRVSLSPTSKADLSSINILVREDSVVGIKNRIVISSDEVQTEMTIPLKSEVDAIGLEVLCTQRGLLYSSKPTPYIKSINFNMNIINKQRNVRIKDRDDSVDEFSVAVHGQSMKSSVGEQRDDRVTNLLLSKEESLIKKKKMAESLGQKWFDKDSENPNGEIRKILNSGLSTIRIVDPYFGSSEIYRFATSLSNSTIPIQILTSKEYLNKGQSAQNMVKALKEIKDLDSQINPIEIRVMMGRKPDIHDRFFAIDSEVWIVGTSLNEFGSRGTVVMKAPYPDPISMKIESVWAESMRFEDYIKTRPVSEKPVKKIRKKVKVSKK
ncbi:MAG: hypothetical protein JSU04_20205 [Bdellovibrionales bacterium]|nr:hypothetical protein [Bdellovibrionales bacterium]